MYLHIDLVKLEYTRRNDIHEAFRMEVCAYFVCECNFERFYRLTLDDDCLML